MARSELEARGARQARPIARDRDDRLLDTLQRFEENQRIDLAANAAYERWRQTARDTTGRVLKGNSKPYTPPEDPAGVINLSDPDSRVMRTQGTPSRQAYNAQAATPRPRSTTARSFSPPRSASPRRTSGTWARCLRPTLEGLREQGVKETPAVGLADAGYWHIAQMQQIAEQGIEVLAPLSSFRAGPGHPGFPLVPHFPTAS